MKISSVMTKDVQLTKPDDTLRSAAALMKRIDAGLLPVTENDKLVGDLRQANAFCLCLVFCQPT
jgi:predicted transcriptional regulator